MRVTQARLKEVFNYDELSGLFTRLLSTSSNCKVGDVASCIDSGGYIVIRIDGTLYRAHQLAWLYMYGEWPKHRVDHKDRDTLNNRIKNLRSATIKQNAENSKDRSDNTSGFRGVVKRRDCNRWVAQIRHNGSNVYLGIFKTPEEASEVYEKARKKMFTHHKELA